MHLASNLSQAGGIQFTYPHPEWMKG